MSTVNDAPLLIDNIRPGASRPAESASRAQQSTTGGEDEVSFWDFLDVINPLQHIPIVSTIYREITGDTIKPIARLAGGALFGGIVGAGMAAVSAAAEGIMGLDDDETMLSFLFGNDGDDRPPVVAGAEVTQQALGAAPEGQESPTQVIARYAQPLDQMARGSQEPELSMAVDLPISGATVPSSAPPLAGEQTASAAEPASPTATAFAALRQRVETSVAPDMGPPDSVLPATAALLDGPEMAEQSEDDDDDAQVPDLIQRALEAQGLGADAASHPMIQALVAGQRVAPLSSGQGAAPQQMPGWFDQAMMQALDRYEETGQLNGSPTRSAAATEI